MTQKVSVDFHPKFLHDNYGVHFGEAYHADPFLRAREWRRVQQELHNRFGQYGLFPAPAAEHAGVLDGIGIQPLDFLNAALGGRLEFMPAEAVWTPDKPLSHIETLDDVRALPEIDWETEPLYRNLLAQYEQLRAADPAGRPTGLQCACHAGGDEAILITHSSYTTAFRLLGDRIFELKMFEEEVAMALFEYIYRQYRRQAEHFCRLAGWRITKIHFGDCAATLLSPDWFERFNLVLAEKIIGEGGYTGCVQHSCGPSSHLLESFTRIPKLEELQLGYGTDLAQARRLFPDTRIIAFYSAAALLNESPEQIGANLERMAAELQEHYELVGSSFDPAPPPDHLTAFLETAQLLNAAGTP